MRDYSKVSGLFWTGGTGKQLRGDLAAQVIAAYLMTCPSSNMIGLYYLPMPTLVHETGVQNKGAMKALRRLSEEGFAHYEAPSEHVWVVEMAHWQVGEPLKSDDNRVKGIIKELELYRKCSFFNMFLDRYGVSFHLQNVSPYEAPPKTLRSQEQNQEQEQEQEQNLSRSTALTYGADFLAFWEAYPRKVAKGEAWKAWQRIRPNGELPLILQAVHVQQSWPDWTKENGRFIPHPATWLNGRRWEDEQKPKSRMPDKPVPVC